MCSSLGRAWPPFDLDLPLVAPTPVAATMVVPVMVASVITAAADSCAVRIHPVARGLGQCLTEDECYGPQCIDSGSACAPYCSWGGDCFDCCSGHCNEFGVCDIPRCSGPGCSCNVGTLAPCDYGLSCCPFDTGLYGGPGVCAPIGSC